MDPEAVKKSLTEPAVGDASALPAPPFDTLIVSGLRLDHAEPGRVLCSYAVPPRLCSRRGVLHGGVVATLVDVIGSAAISGYGIPFSGVSLNINVSYLDAAFVGDEIEIDAKVLRIGKRIAVVSVDLRNKKSGKLIAQGRHTKSLPASSKL